MVDKLKPFTSAWHRRQWIHRHNGFFGSVAMSKAQMQSIIASGTATPRSKRLAMEVLGLLVRLGDSLKERVDEPNLK